MGTTGYKALGFLKSRRWFMGALAATGAMPVLGYLTGQAITEEELRSLIRIRTITAAAVIKQLDDLAPLEKAMTFLKAAKEKYQQAGYQIQTLRIATQPLAAYTNDWMSEKTIDAISEFDKFAIEHNFVFSVGPTINTNIHPQGFAEWAAELIKRTQNISFTVNIASDIGVHYKAIRASAEAIASIARVSKGGEGNFRFAAVGHTRSGTPFFPAAFYDTPDTFSIGLESPRLLTKAFIGASSMDHAKERLAQMLATVAKPIANIALQMEKKLSRHYLGMDMSPAPGPDSSIGEAIESLTGTPFGSASTLQACALITDVLQKGVDVQTCGYSGLMLPVLEDKVLAKRNSEGRYSISELLLYSSVCGTGLDVVPLAGDVSVNDLARLIGDVASLSHKYNKPLSARLFPIPGKSVGESVTFENPFLTDSVIMSLQ